MAPHWPVVRATVAHTLGLWVLLAFTQLASAPWERMFAIWVVLGASLVAAAGTTLFFVGSTRNAKLIALTGETVRGLSVPFWRLPQTRPISELPLTVASISPALFADVPEIVADQQVRGFKPERFWNAWCEKHGHNSPHVKLATRVIRTLASQPQFPAGLDPKHHGARSLLSHSLLVAYHCCQRAETYQYDPRSRYYAPADPKFSFDEHRESPLIMLMGLTHDLGKLTTFVPDEAAPGHYRTIRHEHDRESAFLVSRMDETWDLSTAERDTLIAVIGHYHAETQMPLAAKGRALDDLRHAMVYLLIHADAQAGFDEAQSGARARKATLPINATSAKTPTSTSTPLPLPVAPGAIPKTTTTTTAPPLALQSTRKKPDLVFVSSPGAAAQPVAPVLATASATPQDAVAQAAARLRTAGDPREMKTAQTRLKQETAALAAVQGDSTVLDIFMSLLREGTRINSRDPETNIGLRNDDLARGAKLLVIHEATTRSLISLHEDCPRHLRGEGGMQRRGQMSPLTLELLAALAGKGWLWTPYGGLNRNALYRGYGVTAAHVFDDRAAGRYKPPYSCPVNTLNRDQYTFSFGAVFFVRVDHDETLVAFARLPEYSKHIVTGRNIYGERGATSSPQPSDPTTTAVAAVAALATPEADGDGGGDAADRPMFAAAVNNVVAMISSQALPATRSSHGGRAGFVVSAAELRQALPPAIADTLVICAEAGRFPDLLSRASVENSDAYFFCE